MLIEIKNKFDENDRFSFNVENDLIKIVNSDYRYSIEIEITKENYLMLEDKGFLVKFEMPLIWTSNETEEEIKIIIDNAKKYYLFYQIGRLTDDEIRKLYSDEFFNLTSIEIEEYVVEYNQKHFKSENSVIFVDNVEVDYYKSISNEFITYK
jgi:hypothetical protein